MSLADEISKLANPLPIYHDPEDIGDDTGAKLLSHHVDDDEESDLYSVPSKLRSRAAAQHPEEDTKYSGKRVSRRSLSQDHPSSDEDGEDNSIDSEVESDLTDNDESAENDDVSTGSDDVIKSGEEDEQLAGFREKLKFQETAEKDFSFEDGENDDYGEDDDDDDDEDDDDSEESDEDVESMEEDEGNDDEMQKFTKVNVEDEIQKGRAVKSQLGIWDSFLEGRIKLQKSLLIVNQLPQCDMWTQFAESGGTEYQKTLQENEQFLEKLLSQLVELQTTLLLQNPDTKPIATMDQSPGKSSALKVTDDDDEEITSEDEDDDREESSQSQAPIHNLKRKLKPDEYPEFIAKRHQDFVPFRNATIQKWFDKTRISAGRLSKGFSAFEQSAVKQIDQILGDKERLIKRTQLRRAAYKVLGKVEKKPQSEIPDDIDLAQDRVLLRDHLRDYDEEVFDDDDFYHQQLRELIERKTSDISDPIALSRQWLEIQKMRSKTKKNVDTKASKGRKIRYDVHKKMVNFMAPYDSYQWTDTAKDELYKSLFGKDLDKSHKA